MIFHIYQTIAEFNQTGLDNTLLYVAQTVPLIIPLLLFSIGLIILLTTYFGTKKYTGQGDIIVSFATASIVMFTLASLMTLKAGLINQMNFAIFLVILVISLLLLFFENKFDR